MDQHSSLFHRSVSAEVKVLQGLHQLDWHLLGVAVEADQQLAEVAVDVVDVVAEANLVPFVVKLLLFLTYLGDK